MVKRPLVAVAALAAASACVPAHRAEQSEAAPPAAAAAAVAAPAAATPARLLVERKCSACHGLDVALSGRRTAAEWDQVIEAMIGHGMAVTDEERRMIQAYLAGPR